MQPREREILDALFEYGTYAKAGRDLGISRQRVEQVAKKYAPVIEPLKLLIENLRPPFNPEKRCTVCNKRFGDFARRQYGALCATCKKVKGQEAKGITVRRLFLLNRECPICDRPLDFSTWKNIPRTKKRLCTKCYTKTPEFKAQHAIYQKKYGQTPRRKEKLREYARRYYAKHKAVIDERQRIYGIENHDKLLAYQRSYYQRNIEKMRERRRKKSKVVLTP